MNSLLCCYFPTKVIVVDDDMRILESIKFLMNDKIASCDFFTNPTEALNLINRSKSTDFLPLQLASPEARVFKMHEVMNNSKRHEEISTVFVDYQMPQMNGLEFCEKIENPHIRKILYTGIADEDLAVQAFNKGVIDGYIKKQDPNKYQTLNNFIHTSQLKYFKTLTDILVGSLFKEINSEDPNETAFYDLEFVKFFNEFIKENDICEYYINEIVGGFVCLSSKKKLSILFTYTEKTLAENQRYTDEIIEQVMAEKMPISSKLLKEIEQNQKTICFPSCGKEIEVEPKNWEQHVHSLRTVQGNQIYYVAHATYDEYDNDPKIYSFEQYQRSREKR